MTTTNVAAVIVTYNRADKLGKVIEQVLAQDRPADQVIIVDNASTDGTADVLTAFEGRATVHIERLATNSGGAGGFAHGMAVAYERGADHVWIMDDDCYADPDALRELLDGHASAEASMGMRLPYACSVVRWTDGEICEMNNPEPTWDWGKLLVRGEHSVLVNSCSFVSVLFPRWALTQFGLPLAEYFIWFDDQEYTRRLTAAGPGVQVLRSTVTHDLGVNRGVNFGDVNDGNMWKFEYGVRNEASYRWHHEDPFAALRFAQRLHRGLAGGRVPWRLRRRLARKWLEGIRFDPKPAFPRTVL
ncbi:glycosyltransferase family 2 protein [Geodermatophilus poikilotrophus]|uniref:Glycosyltransferase, GT2 family n=1 Tax=Geodermatophilus poikilotrophus TaxID=1333667 RepID=A0A1I0FNA3_9ACTN|nr:glycosyltransferase family 2 protein [Geodermatophilus poikilotrophus]SET58771.1 Glycosyltransferase, GT2 family [Geodermatophilus poikilotrophus]